MSRLNLRGIFPPIPTPFIKGNVAYDKLILNVKKWNKTGIRGFVVLGSNGEYVYLSEEEKRKIVKTVIKKAAKGKLIIAGTGCESTRETIKLTKDCAQLGADLALVVTPFYYGGKINTKVLINHYTTIADNSPIPILLYNVPKFTHINLGVDIVSMLSKHPNIIGIKDSSGDLSLMVSYIQSTPKNFKIWVGCDTLILAALIYGAAGAVAASASVVPDLVVSIYEHYKKGDLAKALEAQYRLAPLRRMFTLGSTNTAMLKAAANLLGLEVGDPIAPVHKLSDEKEEQLRALLVEQGILR